MGLGGGSSRPWLLSQARQTNSNRVIADGRVMAADESTATLKRHVLKACSGIGSRTVGTRGVLTSGGAVAFAVRIGRCMVPRTPLWSKKEVGRVMVSPICSERYLGSQMVR
jgi:hypothetical protein